MPAASGIVDPSGRLLGIAQLAGALENHELSRDARLAAERLSEGRFYLACVGQFKRGKSALLNALIGEPVLPTGVVPVTTVPTIVRFGKIEKARVRTENHEWRDIELSDIEQYVSEEKNPENNKEVIALEVFVPSALLANGMCLVDTPGLGSVFAGNTAATQAFLPHIDAAIVVLGADPPISGEELNLVEAVSKQVSKILFVLNKADRVSHEERTSAVKFAHQVIEKRLGRSMPALLEVSALERLSNNGPLRDWETLVDKLRSMAQDSGQVLLGDAAERLLGLFSSQLLCAIQEERDAVTRPFEESEKRIAQIRQLVDQSEQALQDLGYLLTAEQHGLSSQFTQRRDLFLKSVRTDAHGKLASDLKTLPRVAGPRYRSNAMHAAQQEAYRRVMPWLESESHDAEEAFRHVSRRFTALGNDFLFRIRSLGGAGFSSLPSELIARQDFHAKTSFEFYDFIHVAMPASPVAYLTDLLLGSVRFYSGINAAAKDFLDRLLYTNSERVRNDLEQRVADSRRQLEAQIRKMLQQITTVAEQSLQRARAAHAAGAPAVESMLSKLVQIEGELHRIADPIASEAKSTR